MISRLSHAQAAISRLTGRRAGSSNRRHDPREAQARRRSRRLRRNRPPPDPERRPGHAVDPHAPRRLALWLARPGRDRPGSLADPAVVRPGRAYAEPRRRPAGVPADRRNGRAGRSAVGTARHAHGPHRADRGQGGGNPVHRPASGLGALCRLRRFPLLPTADRARASGRGLRTDPLAGCRSDPAARLLRLRPSRHRQTAEGIVAPNIAFTGRQWQFRRIDR